ncbi:MAG: M6 family metalloprotease domain-containing protein, partial [bacterium]
SMREWYEENSQGDVVIIGEAVGWYRMPRNYSYYVNQNYGLGGYPRNTQKLTEDAVSLANEDLDFSEFDNDGDDIVDVVVIVFAGSGAEVQPNNVNLIWSHAWELDNRLEVDGVLIRNFICAPEDGAIGVYGHELGHALFGLPDLYDGTGRSRGLGAWSMMSYGSWGNNGHTPVHFDAWCKFTLGWGRVIVIEQLTDQSIAPITQRGEIIYLNNPQGRENEYFLAEYRVRENFDRFLPGEGLLIYHIDENKENNNQVWRPGMDPQRHYKVALEQADGNWDLENNRNIGDAGDPYPGNSGNRTFDLNSTPDSRDYSGEPTGVRIWEIRNDEERISARYDIWDSGEREAAQSIPLRDSWNLVSLRVVPPHRDIPRIVEQLNANGNLLLVKDGRGRFYSPRYNYNDIPRWSETEGYFIKITRGVDWEIEGEVIHPQTPIPLQRGWQIIPYYPPYSLSAPQAFNSLGDALDIVKDGAGHFYVPRFNFNNIPQLTPGRGYLVKMNRESELIYPRD